jgi:hypothetical protein
MLGLNTLKLKSICNKNVDIKFSGHDEFLCYLKLRKAISLNNQESKINIWLSLYTISVLLNIACMLFLLKLRYSSFRHWYFSWKINLFNMLIYRSYHLCFRHFLKQFWKPVDSEEFVELSFTAKVCLGGNYYTRNTPDCSVICSFQLQDGGRNCNWWYKWERLITVYGLAVTT